MVTQSYYDPKPLAKFRLHTGKHGTGDYSDHTAYEPMLELSSRGWFYQQRPGSKQLPSYKKGDQKVWYYCKHICRHYLQVLLLSESLFAAGLQEIFHFQATAYYKTLIFLLQHPSHLNSVKPRQTLDFYKLLQQQVSGRSRRQRENQLESESGGWQWVRSMDFQFWTFNFITNGLCNFQPNYHLTFRRLQHKDASCKIMWIVFRKEGPDWTTHESQWVRIFTLQALSLEAGFRVPKHHQEEEEGLSLEEEGVWRATRKYR